MLELDEALGLATKALAYYDLPADSSLTLVKRRENVVYRLDSGELSYALRLHRVGYRTDAQLTAELAHMSRLATAGVTLPTVFETIAGEQFCRVVDARGTVHQVDLLSWFDASPMGDIAEAFAGTESVHFDRFEQLGGLLAQMHAEVATWPAEPLDRVAWDLEGLAGADLVWGDPLRAFADGSDERAIVAKALEVARERVSDYGQGRDVFGPIHGDCTPENVLLAADRMYVIDFDDFGEGYFLFDLATVLFFYGPHPNRNQIAKSLLRGYQSQRKLSPADLAMLDVFDFLRGTTYLGWSADRRGDETAEFILAEVAPHVLHLAQGVLDSAPLGGQKRARR